MSDVSIEERLHQNAAPLPPHLRHRVLDACSSKAAMQAKSNRRANWRLAFGFAAVCLVQWIVGGALDTQQRVLLGTSDSHSLTASTVATNQFASINSMMLRSRLLAELSDPHQDRF